MGQAAALLQPLAEAITRHVKAGAALHADDTPVPVLDPGRQRTKIGRLWVLARDERPCAGPAPPAVTYLYSPDRKGEHAQTLLQGCTGFLHAPADVSLRRLLRRWACPAYWQARAMPASTGSTSRPNARHSPKSGCWAHARRKLYDVHAATNSPLAREALERIAQLFVIEAGINGHAPTHRLASRRELSLPKLDALRAFLEQSVNGGEKVGHWSGGVIPLRDLSSDCRP